MELVFAFRKNATSSSLAAYVVRQSKQKNVFVVVFDLACRILEGKTFRSSFTVDPSITKDVD